MAIFDRLFKRKKRKSKKQELAKKKRKKKAIAEKGRGRPKKPRSLVLTKYPEAPIIGPKPEHEWEAWQTFNPGVILLENKVHFLYRAIGQDGISRLGYAFSNDGFLIDERLPYPVYEHAIGKTHFSNFTFYSFSSGYSFGGAEDPRPVRVEQEDTIYLTYTACDDGLRVALTSIKVKDFLAKRWHWKTPSLISPPGQIHKNWVIFPEKINGQYAILHSLSPEVLIDFRQTLEFKEGEYIFSSYDGRNENGGWEEKIKGIGPPPLKTKYGWLIFYHGIDKFDPGKYKVGVMLLDLTDPKKIIYRCPHPILEPEEVYEINGFKPGIVYASGAIIKDGNLLIYYGAADSYVGVAYTNLEEFLETLFTPKKPKLRQKIIKKKR